MNDDGGLRAAVLVSGPVTVAPVILENGPIRTLDPQLPLARALAIAGDRIAGGVGVHETALASPDVVDLGGRCVLPGFTDSHVHFPTWALAQREVRLESARSVDDALALVAGAAAELPEGRWLRGFGWRDFCRRRGFIVIVTTGRPHPTRPIDLWRQGTCGKSSGGWSEDCRSVAWPCCRSSRWRYRPACWCSPARRPSRPG